MKKLLVILLVFAFVAPSVVAAGPPPQGPPPPPPEGLPSPEGPPLVRDVVPPVGPRDMRGVPKLSLADRPKLAELPDMELMLEKRAKGEELIRSLTDEQQARVAQLLADNPLPVPVRVGQRVQAMRPDDISGRQIEAMKALLPKLESWQATMSSGLAGVLTPEQYQVYQDSLPPAPVQLADIGPQTYNDCYYEYAYANYAQDYAYYGYLYAYYSYYYGEDLLSYELYLLAYDDYLYAYYGYMYSYYATAYYYDSAYAYYAYYYNVHAMVLAYHTAGLAYDIYAMTGSTYAYYAYLYEYYKYVYETYAYSYGYYCYVD
jgi:hypothetical protein